MGLQDVRIDERTWQGASESRQMEWTTIIREMLQPGEAEFAQPVETLSLTLTQQSIEVRGGAGGEFTDITLPHDKLAPLITEYVDVVRQIAQVEVIAKLEALDMAKKATHDKAARLVKRLLRPIGPDHPTARRLFTLILALRVDTTRIIGVHGHRRIR